MKRIVRIVFFLLGIIITGNTAIAASNSDYETARKYYYSGRYNQAVRYLQDYIAQKPDASAYYMMGYALYKLKRFDEANQCFQDAYLLNPAFSPTKEAGTGDQQKKPAKPRRKGSGASAASQPSAATAANQTAAPSAELPPAAKSKKYPAP